MRAMLGIEVPDDLRGVLQDIHWSEGIIGYFPTYAIGNVLAAQLWRAARADLPGLDDDLRAGEYANLRAWLVEHVHRHGRRLTPPELIEQRRRRAARPGADARAPEREVPRALRPFLKLAARGHPREDRVAGKRPDPDDDPGDGAGIETAPRRTRRRRAASPPG